MRPQGPTATSDIRDCPACGTRTVRYGDGEPWCPHCEWNLMRYEPVREWPVGWRWVDRLGYARSARLDQALFRDLATEKPRPAGMSGAHLTLLLVSAGLLLALAASLVTGTVLLILHPSPLLMVLGGALVLLAVILHPPLYRPPPVRERLTPEQAPTLFELIARIARRIGCEMPHHVVITNDYNASVSQTGLRQHTTLRIGMLLWLVLTPQQRVVLLAHELGHTVNGDPRRGLLIRPALAIFSRLAEWTGVERSIGYVLHPDRPGRNYYRTIGELALYLVSRTCLVIHLALLNLALRDHQRAEYLADDLSAQIAGSDAVVSLLDSLLLSGVYLRIVEYSATSRPPDQWPGLVAEAIDARRSSVSSRRQLSRRRTSIWDSHPPDGLRAQIVELRPRREAALVLGENASAQIDRELAGHYRTLHSHVLGTRDFRPLVARPETGVS